MIFVVLFSVVSAVLSKIGIVNVYEIPVSGNNVKYLISLSDVRVSTLAVVIVTWLGNMIIIYSVKGIKYLLNKGKKYDENVMC